MKLKDLTATMAVIVRVHVKNFQSDFIYDKAMLRERTLSGSDDDEVTEPFIWMTREIGTHFCYLRDLKENRLTVEAFLYDRKELHSLYSYDGTDLHAIDRKTLEKIINKWRTPSQK